MEVGIAIVCVVLGDGSGDGNDVEVAGVLVVWSGLHGGVVVESELRWRDNSLSTRGVHTPGEAHVLGRNPVQTKKQIIISHTQQTPLVE